ncbi:hypothetical protein KC207_01405 [Phycicoccus sp. BSK3Z-2]|uniref:Putative zinc-ribbon domain-containing protein n=1 Tax=Phycicoccus avicenniae TaxID=2828860 RepID=A0A941D7I1_9MICO|nr:zinc ribbon domain-containing protein [Phycicoccus avicenniae]MBR7741947.1 hypothetical protein [Phycicoccus avicenniae]
MSAFGRKTASCPECGAGVRADDRFCSECGLDLFAGTAEPGEGGYPQQSTSLYDEIMPGAGAAAVGTAAADDRDHGDDDHGHDERTYDEDLAPTDEQPVHRPEDHAVEQPTAAHPGSAGPDPRDAEPQGSGPAHYDPYDAGDGYDEPRYDGPAPVRAAYGAPAPRAEADDAHDPYGPDAYDDRGVPVDGDRRSRGGGVLFPALVVLLVVLLAAAGWLLLGPDGDDSQTAAPSPSSTGSVSPSPEDSASSEGEPSESPSQSPSAEESADEPEAVEIPASAEQCEEVGGATAYRGNDVTSCPFAVSVTRALLEDSPDLPATVTATSPVTDEEYAMECEDTAPVVCRGGDDAVVYVERPDEG